MPVVGANVYVHGPGDGTLRCSHWAGRGCAAAVCVPDAAITRKYSVLAAASATHGPSATPAGDVARSVTSTAWLAASALAPFIVSLIGEVLADVPGSVVTEPRATVLAVHLPSAGAPSLALTAPSTGVVSSSASVAVVGESSSLRRRWASASASRPP